jgi:hypothetical protein
MTPRAPRLPSVGCSAVAPSPLIWQSITNQTMQLAGQ